MSPSLSVITSATQGSNSQKPSKTSNIKPFTKYFSSNKLTKSKKQNIKYKKNYSKSLKETKSEKMVLLDASNLKNDGLGKSLDLKPHTKSSPKMSYNSINESNESNFKIHNNKTNNVEKFNFSSVSCLDLNSNSSKQHQILKNHRLSFRYNQPINYDLFDNSHFNKNHKLKTEFFFANGTPMSNNGNTTSNVTNNTSDSNSIIKKPLSSTYSTFSSNTAAKIVLPKPPIQITTLKENNTENGYSNKNDLIYDEKDKKIETKDEGENKENQEKLEDEVSRNIFERTKGSPSTDEKRNLSTKRDVLSRHSSHLIFQHFYLIIAF